MAKRKTATVPVESQQGTTPPAGYLWRQAVGMATMAWYFDRLEGMHRGPEGAACRDIIIDAGLRVERAEAGLMKAFDELYLGLGQRVLFELLEAAYRKTVAAKVAMNNAELRGKRERELCLDYLAREFKMKCRLKANLEALETFGITKQDDLLEFALSKAEIRGAGKSGAVEAAKHKAAQVGPVGARNLSDIRNGKRWDGNAFVYKNAAVGRYPHVMLNVIRAFVAQGFDLSSKAITKDLLGIRDWHGFSSQDLLSKGSRKLNHLKYLKRRIERRGKPG